MLLHVKNPSPHSSGSCLKIVRSQGPEMDLVDEIDPSQGLEMDLEDEFDPSQGPEMDLVKAEETKLFQELGSSQVLQWGVP